MPPIRQLAQLFQALSAKDLGTAKQIAMQIASLEEKKGHRSAAQLLKGSLQSNGIKGHRLPEPISGILTSDNFLEGALSLSQKSTRLKDVMLRPRCQAALEALVNETRHGDYLLSRGIRRRSKVLFVGPPGCGKSFTAHAIAN
jgi:SpoVK/Ycf46/Vps4 family AAA+-type ATPase